MTRFYLTLKQHRFEVIGAILVCLAFAGLALYEVWQLNAIVWPKDCSPNGAFGVSVSGADPCSRALERFNAIQNGTLMRLIQLGLLLAPFVAAILLGAPVVAREIEQNTAPMSWALVGSRRRWLVVRLASLLIVLVPLMLVVGFCADQLYGALHPGTNTWLTLDDYNVRGLPVLFWSLAAFLGTVALGTIFGRSLPAVFLALVICLFARVGGQYGFEQIVLAPSAQPVMSWQELTSPNGYNWPATSLVLEWRSWLDGKPFEGDVDQWYRSHTPPTDPPAANTQGGEGGGIPAGYVGPWGPIGMPYGFRGDTYWPIVAAESGILAGGSVVLASVALFWVGRRRPY
jgi:hypothetical protein